MIKTSQARLVPLRAKEVGSVLMQVPGMLRSHCLAIWLHANDKKTANISWLTITRVRTT
jgi:hypothetical protein